MKGTKIKLHFLPSHSPTLNVIERLWKFFKKEILHNTYYENFADIGRLLNVSHTAVFGWVRQAGEQVELPVSDETVEVAELDEIHTFACQKKLPLDLDCGRSLGQAFFVICLRRSFYANGSKVMGQVKGLVGRSVDDGSLAGLRRFYSAGAASAIESRDMHGGRR